MRRTATLAMCALLTALAASPAESAGPPLGLNLGNGSNSRKPQAAAAAAARLRQSAAVRARNAAAASSLSSSSQAGGSISRGGAALRNRLQTRMELRANSRQSATVRADASLGVSASAGGSSEVPNTAGQPSGDGGAGYRPGSRPANRAEVALRNRLAAIDRMRDVAVESGDLQLLERADLLEARARAQFRAEQQASVPLRGVVNAGQQTVGDVRFSGRQFGQNFPARAREFRTDFESTAFGQSTVDGNQLSLQKQLRNSAQFSGGNPAQSPETKPAPPAPAPAPAPAAEGRPSSPAVQPPAQKPSPEPKGRTFEAEASFSGTASLQSAE